MPQQIVDRLQRRIVRLHIGWPCASAGCRGRLEIKIAVQEWLRRSPEFKLKPGTKIEYRPGGVIGPERVPLEW